MPLKANPTPQREPPEPVPAPTACLSHRMQVARTKRARLAVAAATLSLGGCMVVQPGGGLPSVFAPAGQQRPSAQQAEERFAQLSALAAEGNPAAEYTLGNLYHSGKGVPQNDAIAFQWLYRAAIQGDAPAENGLGYLYNHGQGVPQNFALAMYWYRKAADAGNVTACGNIGYLYLNGQGVGRSLPQAFWWLHRAALAGEAVAEENVAYMYQQGWGTDRNVAKALLWYQRAARQGNTAAKILLERLQGTLGKAAAHTTRTLADSSAGAARTSRNSLAQGKTPKPRPRAFLERPIAARRIVVRVSLRPNYRIFTRTDRVITPARLQRLAGQIGALPIVIWPANANGPVAGEKSITRTLTGLSGRITRFLDARTLMEIEGEILGLVWDRYYRFNLYADISWKTSKADVLVFFVELSPTMRFHPASRLRYDSYVEWYYDYFLDPLTSLEQMDEARKAFFASVNSPPPIIQDETYYSPSEPRDRAMGWGATDPGAISRERPSYRKRLVRLADSGDIVAEHVLYLIEQCRSGQASPTRPGPAGGPQDAARLSYSAVGSDASLWPCSVTPFPDVAQMRILRNLATRSWIAFYELDTYALLPREWVPHHVRALEAARYFMGTLFDPDKTRNEQIAPKVANFALAWYRSANPRSKYAPAAAAGANAYQQMLRTREQHFWQKSQAAIWNLAPQDMPALERRPACMLTGAKEPKSPGGAVQSVWIASGATGSLYRLTRGGRLLERCDRVFPAHRGQPAMAVDRAGTTWVALADQVAEISAGGAVREFSLGNLDIHELHSNPYAHIRNIVTDRAGNAWLLLPYEASGRGRGAAGSGAEGGFTSAEVPLLLQMSPAGDIREHEGLALRFDPVTLREDANGAVRIWGAVDGDGFEAAPSGKGLLGTRHPVRGWTFRPAGRQVVFAVHQSARAAVSTVFLYRRFLRFNLEHRRRLLTLRGRVRLIAVTHPAVAWLEWREPKDSSAHILTVNARGRRLGRFTVGRVFALASRGHLWSLQPSSGGSASLIEQDALGRVLERVSVPKRAVGGSAADLSMLVVTAGRANYADGARPHAHTGAE